MTPQTRRSANKDRDAVAGSDMYALYFVAGVSPEASFALI
jgi:hypothetical protein